MFMSLQDSVDLGGPLDKLAGGLSAGGGGKDAHCPQEEEEEGLQSPTMVSSP
jgi:hypothetical protein